MFILIASVHNFADDNSLSNIAKLLIVRSKKICLKSANQINPLVRLKRLLGNEKRKVLINSYVLLNFNCCPLDWMLTNAKFAHKIKAIQKRAWRFMLNNYESS